MSEPNAIESLGLVGIADAAVEEGAAARAARMPPPIAFCRNCATPVPGRFCTNCGQGLHEENKSISSLAGEFIEGIFNFDSRLANTLKALLFMPGRMTSEYNAGRRARYVPPVKFYLFISLVFFLVLSATNVALFVLEVIPDDAAVSETQVAKVGGLSGQVEFSMPKIKGVRVRFLVDLDSWKPTIQLNISEIQKEIQAQGDMSSWQARAALGLVESVEHPQSLNRRLGDNFAQLMFVAMPIYALLLSLLYRRKRLFFVEHFAFAVHIHCFIFVILILLVGIQEAAGGRVDLLETGEFALGMLMLVAGYVWLALRTAYGQGVFKTTVKWLLLGSVYTITLSMGLIGLIVASLPGG